MNNESKSDRIAYVIVMVLMGLLILSIFAILPIALLEILPQS
jgi:hypothetical protein